MQTKQYYNNSGADLANVTGIGDIPAGETISITSQYPPAIVLENFPGLVDVSDFQQSDWDALIPPTSSSSSSSSQTTNTSTGTGS